MARSTASFNFQVVSTWHAAASSYPRPYWIFLEGFQLSPKSFTCVCTLMHANTHTHKHTHRAGHLCQCPPPPRSLCLRHVPHSSPQSVSLTPLVRCSFMHFPNVRRQQYDKGQSYLHNIPPATLYLHPSVASHLHYQHAGHHSHRDKGGRLAGFFLSRSLLAPIPSTIFLTVAGGIFEIFHPSCGPPARRVKPSSTASHLLSLFSAPTPQGLREERRLTPASGLLHLLSPQSGMLFLSAASSPLAGVNVTVSPLLGEVFLGSRSYMILFISVEEQRAPS